MLLERQLVRHRLIVEWGHATMLHPRRNSSTFMIFSLQIALRKYEHSVPLDIRCAAVDL